MWSFHILSMIDVRISLCSVCAKMCIRDRAGPALRLPDRKPACPGGSDRSAADRERYKRLLSASLSGSKRTVLLVSG